MWSRRVKNIMIWLLFTLLLQVCILLHNSSFIHLVVKSCVYFLLMFPFHARQYDKRIIIHVLVVLLAVVLPPIIPASHSQLYNWRLCDRQSSFFILCIKEQRCCLLHNSTPMSMIGATGVSLIFVVLVKIIKVNSFYMYMEVV